jgi:hypothetical protein
MGANQSNINNYGLSPMEIQQLQSFFAQVAGRDGRLDINEFTMLYQQMNPNYTPQMIQTIAQRAFMAADTNRDGRMDFNEYLTAYILSKDGNVQQNLGLLMQNQNQITPTQARQYYNQMNQFYGRNLGENDWNDFNSRFGNQNHINPNEFMNYAAPRFNQFTF